MLAKAAYRRDCLGMTDQETRFREYLRNCGPDLFTAVERRVELLRAEHPSALQSRKNLARDLYGQGKFAEAEQEWRGWLALQVRIRGLESLDTIATRNHLAATLDAQGKHAEAEHEFRQVLSIGERVLGADHPEVLRSCFNLAWFLEKQGRLTEALELARRAEDGLKRVPGKRANDFINSVLLRGIIEAKMARK